MSDLLSRAFLLLTTKWVGGMVIIIWVKERKEGKERSERKGQGADRGTAAATLLAHKG